MKKGETQQKQAGKHTRPFAITEKQTEVQNDGPGLILDFCVSLGKRMIVSGANIERVSLAMETVCHAYKLTDVSLFLMNTHISLSARDENGSYASRQSTIPPSQIHLSLLKKLNRLSYKVAGEPPEVEKLSALLEETAACPSQKGVITLLAQVGAMICLSLIFGGSLTEAVCVALVTVLMYCAGLLLAHPGFDRVLTIAITMWAAGFGAIFLEHMGLDGNETIVLITVCMLMIPGIPLVNAARNVMCGNEMNGVIQLLKITVEVAALAVGVYAAQKMFGTYPDLNGRAEALTDPILLILVSFGASFFFAVVFRVDPHDLVLAGLGGVISRVALILLTPHIEHRMLYMVPAALAAALYAEFLATKRRDPSTYFLYPSIIPLIPGDLFYYFIRGLITGEEQTIVNNGVECILALAGMSVGFVLSSIIAHYVRRFRFRRQKRPA